MNFAVWRLVLDGVATLQEIETWWSIDDLADAHEALDVRASIEAAVNQKNRARKG